MSIWDAEDQVDSFEPIQPKDNCELKVVSVEPDEWKVKDGVIGHEGETTKSVKMQLQIMDKDVETKSEGAKPRRNFEIIFNVAPHYYLSKDNEVKVLGRSTLFQLEEAMGFDPIYVNGDGPVEPFVTRTGRKRAPKGDGVKRKVNPDYVEAYFYPDGNIKPDNWVDKTLYAKVGIRESDQFGDKNVVKAFKPAPVS